MLPEVIPNRNRKCYKKPSISRIGQLVKNIWPTTYLGAIGLSGKMYYLIPPDKTDGTVSDPNDKSWFKDGISGSAGDVGWVRFNGGCNNVLNKFIDLHAEQGNPGGSLEALRQY